MSEERERYVAHGEPLLNSYILTAGRWRQVGDEDGDAESTEETTSPPPPPSPTAMAASDMMEELGFSWFARALRGEVDLPQNVRSILAEGPVDYAQWSRSIFESMANRLGIPGAWLDADSSYSSARVIRWPMVIDPSVGNADADNASADLPAD